VLNLRCKAVVAANKQRVFPLRLKTDYQSLKSCHFYGTVQGIQLP
jgi:hypothetical protein